MSAPHDVLIVGGGIVGLATAHAVQSRLPAARVVVVDKEPAVAAHQTGHNSGVVHSGIYYRPGSTKAELAVRGAEAMLAFCAEHGVAHDRCGKLVVATDPGQLVALAALAERARANGVAVAELGPGGAADHEPEVRCVGALHVPSTGRADFAAVTRTLAGLVAEAGGEVRTGCLVRGARREDDGWTVDTSLGPMETRFLVGCAGLQADRVARRSGVDPGARILPFRGEYLDVTGASADLVRGLIYPVPDPDLPFLGVHLTRGLDGHVHAGPNAVPALAREGYRRHHVSPVDVAGALAWPGSWRLARRHWRHGLAEIRRSADRGRFAASVQELVPRVTAADLIPAPAGVRAQAVGRDGALLDDFHLVDGDRSVHVVNAPSPAATASLLIGERVADRVVAGWR